MTKKKEGGREREGGILDIKDKFILDNKVTTSHLQILKHPLENGPH